MSELPQSASDNSALSALQLWLVTQLQRRKSLPKNAAISAEAAAHLTGNDRLTPVEQLEIYREQFWLRHTASLVEDFPGVGGILGQNEWEGLVESYLEGQTPVGWTLRELGRQFPAHVAAQANLSHQALCTDMARLEWQFIELFDALDAAPLDLNKLSELPSDVIERGRIVLNPALSLLEVEYPVADLRQALIRGRSAGEGNAVVIPDPERQQLVLYRGQNRRLYHRPVSPAAFALLTALNRGTPLVAACESAIEQAPDHAGELQQNVGSWFRQWATRGWIVDVAPAT